MEEKKKYNPGFGMAFGANPKIAPEGSVSIKLDEAGIKTLVANLQVGSTLVFKLKPNKTSTGNAQYFTEIMPPYKGPKDNGMVPSKGKKYSELD